MSPESWKYCSTLQVTLLTHFYTVLDKWSFSVLDRLVRDWCKIKFLHNILTLWVNKVFLFFYFFFITFRMSLRMLSFGLINMFLGSFLRIFLGLQNYNSFRPELVFDWFFILKKSRSSTESLVQIGPSLVQIAVLIGP